MEKHLSPEALRHRLRYDYHVCQQMQGSIFTFEAYRSTQDMAQRKNPITSIEQGHLATLYRVDYHVKTLIGPGQYATLTTIGFDVSPTGYPYVGPATWVISDPVPYSPHFSRGSAICIGDIWMLAQGKWPLGRLIVHIAKLLNWDEISRGPDYSGFNGEAIRYHREVYHSQPITPNLCYPVPPSEILLGEDMPALGKATFRHKEVSPSPDSSFKKKG